MIVKIDSPSCIADALALRDAGCDIISVTVETAHRWEGLDGIRDKLCVRIDLAKTTESECEKQLADLGSPKFVEFEGHVLPGQGLLEGLAAKGSQPIFSQISADLDSDPSWILSRYQDANYDRSITPIYQILLVCDEADGWDRLLSKPTNSDGLEISDMQKLTDRHRTLITLNFGRVDIRSLFETLPRIGGVSIPMKANPYCNLVFSRNEISTLLAAIRN